MKNGRDDHWDDPKITSISAARKKQADNRKQAAPGSPRRSIGQLLTGAVIVAMALGMLAWWGRSLMQAMSVAP